jgi:hypothetical protein
LEWILNLESPKSKSQPKQRSSSELLLMKEPSGVKGQYCSLRASVQYQNVAQSQDIAHVRVRMTFSYQIRTETEHDVL